MEDWTLQYRNVKAVFLSGKYVGLFAAVHITYVPNFRLFNCDLLAEVGPDLKLSTINKSLFFTKYPLDQDPNACIQLH